MMQETSEVSSRFPASNVGEPSISCGNLEGFLRGNLHQTWDNLQ